MISPGETVVWRDKPDKRCFILEAIFNPMLFFALLWAAIDLTFISSMLSTLIPDPEADVAGPDYSQILPLVFFFALHLMPVWIYLGGIISAIIKHRSVEYIMTDQAVYLFEGGMSEKMRRLAWKNVREINCERGIFDRMFKVGDIRFEAIHGMTYQSGKNRRKKEFILSDVTDYQSVYRKAAILLQDAKYLND